jgi:CO/xanthine dehydrogenase Mo-binding subunit
MSVAIKIACDAIKAELLRRASTTLDLPEDQLEYADGSVRAKANPDHRITIKALGEASITSTGGPIVQTGVSSRLPQAPSFAAHVVDLEVDPETGKVKILKYTAFQDCGFAINPTQVEGQIQGGVVQGIGWALNEGYVFDQGTMRNPTWLDYRMPTALDLPMIDPELVEIANPAGPYGIRGVGEVPIVPPMAAIANAISNAIGTRLVELPMNPERVLMETLKNQK